MQINTRLHDSYDGSIARNVSSINFNTMSPGAKSGKVILSLHVEGVASVSDIVFEIMPSEHVDLEAGVIRYDKSMIFERKDDLASRFSSERRTVALRAINNTSSELLYLEMDSSLGITDGGSFSCKWSFNYVPSSSSSSSSSSNLYIACTPVDVDETVISTLSEDEEECFIIHMDPSEHSTIVLNGSYIENYNNDGQLFMNDTQLILNDTLGIYLGGTYFSTRLNYTDLHDFFVVNMKNIGISSSSAETPGNTQYTLVTMTNSSSCSSSSSSSPSSSCSSSSSLSSSSSSSSPSSSSYSSSSSSPSSSSSSPSSSCSSSSPSSSSCRCEIWTSTLNSTYPAEATGFLNCSLGGGSGRPHWDGKIQYYGDCEWRTTVSYWSFGVTAAAPTTLGAYGLYYARVWTTNAYNWHFDMYAYYTFGSEIRVIWGGVRSGQGPYGDYKRTTSPGYCTNPWPVGDMPLAMTIS